MAEYFAGGHLRFVNGEWRDDNGDAIEISRVQHGRWEWFKTVGYVITVMDRTIGLPSFVQTAAQRWTEATAIAI